MLCGDEIYARHSDGSSGHLEFQGYVHFINMEQVWKSVERFCGGCNGDVEPTARVPLQFHPNDCSRSLFRQVGLRFNDSFHQNWMRGREFDIRFSVKRSSFVIMHEAIQLMAEGYVDLRTVMPGLMLLFAGAGMVLPPPPPTLLPLPPSLPPPPPPSPRDLSEAASNAIRIAAIAAGQAADDRAATSRLLGGSSAGGSLSGGVRVQVGPTAGGSLSGRALVQVSPAAGNGLRGVQVQVGPAAGSGLSDVQREHGLSWANQSLDAQQRLAVERILDGRYAPRPFMVFGPPGTGKTRYDEEIGTVGSCTARGYCPYGTAPPVSASTCFSFYTTRHAHCPTL